MMSIITDMSNMALHSFGIGFACYGKSIIPPSRLDPEIRLTNCFNDVLTD